VAACVPDRPAVGRVEFLFLNELGPRLLASCSSIFFQ
jgi:hypothetical protein